MFNASAMLAFTGLPVQQTGGDCMAQDCAVLYGTHPGVPASFMDAELLTSKPTFHKAPVAFSNVCGGASQQDQAYHGGLQDASQFNDVHVEVALCPWPYSSLK